MSMLPEFKCKRGHNDPIGALFLTSALNCESICPVYRQVSDFILIMRILQLRNSP